jgi:hypothetical protein
LFPYFDRLKPINAGKGKETNKKLDVKKKSPKLTREAGEGIPAYKKPDIGGAQWESASLFPN